MKTLCQPLQTVLSKRPRGRDYRTLSLGLEKVTGLKGDLTPDFLSNIEKQKSEIKLLEHIFSDYIMDRGPRINLAFALLNRKNALNEAYSGEKMKASMLLNGSNHKLREIRKIAELNFEEFNIFGKILSSEEIKGLLKFFI